jgi:hypothetical protein
VEDLLDTMSSAEISEWMEYYKLEPFGAEVENLMLGTVAATVANFSGRSRGNAKASDFVVKFEKEQSPEEMMNAIGAWLGSK